MSPSFGPSPVPARQVVMLSFEGVPIPRATVLEARARRAEQTKRVRPGLKGLPEPDVADSMELAEPEKSAEDRRGAANRGLCRQQLERVEARRAELEAAIVDLVDAKVLPRLPAIDSAVLMLFMAELHEGLSLPVACSEAVDLSIAYGGMSDSHRYVNGVLGAYAREHLKLKDC
jgi:transcription termination factor NusB